MELKGKLLQLLPLQTGEGKNGPWKKQEIIIETTEGQFPKKICISVWGDKINESMLKLGNDLKVSFDIESREYNSRWYTDVKAWKIELAGSDSASGFAPQSNSDFPSIDQMPPSEEDVLPF